MFTALVLGIGLIMFAYGYSESKVGGFGVEKRREKGKIIRNVGISLFLLGVVHSLLFPTPANAAPLVQEDAPNSNWIPYAIGIGIGAVLFFCILGVITYPMFRRDPNPYCTPYAPKLPRS